MSAAYEIHFYDCPLRTGGHRRCMCDTWNESAKPVPPCQICDTCAWYVVLHSDQDGDRLQLICTSPDCSGGYTITISTKTEIVG